ncbi:MAG: hypothetical protein KKG47_03500 [Proteobacteria bacterium]|nr:hypothetical protein [Pseudomonadota bacterium]MBU1739283.1 hypothetical protein [Pseudomonadota bacterium]
MWTYVKPRRIFGVRVFKKYCTWWSYRFNARARNIGWRIDSFCVDEKSRKRVRGSSIRPEITGSDHCPIELVWK